MAHARTYEPATIWKSLLIQVVLATTFLIGAFLGGYVLAKSNAATYPWAAMLLSPKIAAMVLAIAGIILSLTLVIHLLLNRGKVGLAFNSIWLPIKVVVWMSVLIPFDGGSSLGLMALNWALQLGASLG